MNGKHGRQRTLALIGTLAALLPAGTAWSQTAPLSHNFCAKRAIHLGSRRSMQMSRALRA
ncbi:hypothetical protein GCM10020258_59520 [Sphingomonas yabuuchiae]